MTKKHSLIFYTLIGLLLQKHLYATEDLMPNAQELPSHKSPPLLMTHQDVTDRLSQGMFPSSKMRMKLAVAPAKPEYLTEEFITLVQNLFQKMKVYEKCYIIRAVMKFPAAQLIMLNDILTIERVQQFTEILPMERVTFIKKLREKELDLWEGEIKRMIKEHDTVKK